MTMIDSIKKLLGMDKGSSDAVNQVPPSHGHRTEAPVSPSDVSSDIPSDLPQQPETEPFEPKP